MGSYILSPSLLSANFANLQKDLAYAQENGAQWLHFDVMDGHFVPNLTFGLPVISALRNLTSLVFDVHLMVKNPADYVDTFKRAGADFFTFHVEAETHVDRLIHAIKDSGMKAGITFVPSTPVSALIPVLPLVDLVLVMSVNPGFSGQKFIPYCLEKISALAKIRQERGAHFLLSVDGGINASNIQSVLDAGCDVVVSGSSFFSGDLRK
ncbi:MAG: ribulose-phosphate 3-epimerase [Spirochaetaceae bacterium]|nr:ribulose-phosphate 3-epimerase [Spirochaetaceae bacterium]